MGRFMEGVAALLGITLENLFEADAAMRLEFVATQEPTFAFAFESAWSESCRPVVWDWRPWIRGVAERVLRGEAVGPIALELHLILAEALWDRAVWAGVRQVVLGGGVFQNRLLMTLLLRQAEERQMQLITPQRIPINDGGVAMGQIFSLSGRPLSASEKTTHLE
jgi:hydrogenase maturation protein HypF